MISNSQILQTLLSGELRTDISDCGGESVLVNGAVFKTVSETVRTGSGRFDSYTPPPNDCGMQIGDCGAGLYEY